MAACERCFAEFAANEPRCAVCGAPRTSPAPEVWSSEPTPAATAAEQAALERPAASKKPLAGLAENPWVVLATIFFVTAAFGIPLIWMCKAWSDNTKVVLTVITILYTILILWLFYLVMAWCYGNIMQAFA
jgi:hypothetical protein